MLEVTTERQTTTTAPQSSLIPSPSECILTTLRLKTAEQTLLKINYSKVFFLSFEKREFRRGGDLTWERHRHQVGKTSFECYGLKFSSPTATIKMFKILRCHQIHIINIYQYHCQCMERKKLKMHTS